jgi:tetratricopeptide (TPR) repeat protein
MEIAFPLPRPSTAGAIRALVFGVALFSACGAFADEWTYRMHQGSAAHNQGDYREAVVHYEAALRETEADPPEDMRRAGTLISLAAAYKGLAQFAEAEKYYKDSLAWLDAARRPQQAGVLVKLGELYVLQGRYDEAEVSYRGAIATLERSTGPHSPNVARVLKTHVSLLYRAQSRWDEVAAIYARALDVYLKAYGEAHVEVATTLLDLAGAYEKHARYAEAEAAYQRALPTWIKLKGADHQGTAFILVEIGRMHRFQRRDAESESYFLRALAILQRSLGPRHHEVGVVLHYLAALYEAQGRRAEADDYYARWIAIQGGPYRGQFRGTSPSGPLIVRQGR